jgi:hypothetical protein
MQRDGNIGRRAAREKEMIPRVIFPIAAFTACMLLLRGQSELSSVQSAHKAWRDKDATLERDAADGGAKIADRAGKASIEAEKFGRAKEAFYRSSRTSAEQRAQWIEGLEALFPAGSLESAKGHQDAAAFEITALNRSIKSLAADRDPGIQRVRQAMERELAALDAVQANLAGRQKALEAARKTSDAVDQLKTRLAADYRTLAAAFKQFEDLSGRETQTLNAYYKKIGEAASISIEARVNPPDPAVTSAPPATAPPPKPSPRLTPGGISINRYLGGWTFPVPNGLSFGPEPEFVDLIVREEGDRVSGALSARYKLPSGSPGDPLVRFEFSGKPGPARTQKFDLETSDGARGTIELIPGPAINLLEINYQIEPRPNKIRQSNVVLLRK